MLPDWHFSLSASSGPAFVRALSNAGVNRKSGRAWSGTALPVEQRIAELRVELRDSVLGESGARAIRSVLQGEMECAPGEATINRVLAHSDCRMACAAFADRHRRRGQR